ncbi:MAG: CatB-related O-acetyltransferase [Selenomonadaceae bacterium]|nr:CatB-related O-acetyltransferase [Selenomonadaceae bacterium]
MVFKVNCSAKDEKFFSDINGTQENLFTLGRGSYAKSCDVSFFHEKSVNALGGRFSSMAPGLSFFIGGNHPIKNVSSSPLDVGSIVKLVFGVVRPNLRPIVWNRHNPRQIIIGNDVWIGQGVTIMGGVKIGNGAVIGARAVVAKDIPPYAIAVGNPARVVKYRFDEEMIRKFLAVKWWNWDLEKIADNFPLMNDVEKFLEAHYSPELEEFPEDDFSRQLKGFKTIYQFIPDFQATQPLWSKVVKDFTQAKLADAVLVIWLGKDTTDENAKALTEAIGDNKNILTFKHEENFSPTALRLGTHFITTREMITLEALDYLWNTDVKIISALDNGIFLPSKPKENSSAAKPQGTNPITLDEMINLGTLDYLWNA